ncbi:hypothetical protein [Desulfolucanica intricata]|uniref:hypothetical protein n=1 Tax=Desulfolucanica intricata TaxID=1285191 RepID=UPI000831123C|nr:hypothetical protein [Desulfolucanica intricata]
MIFSQYKKLLQQIGEIQKPICTLEKSQRLELFELSARQEIYEKDIEDSIKLVLGELKRCLEDFKNWLDNTTVVVEQTFGPGGTPKKIVALEETFNRACLIKEQIQSLVGPELEVAAAAAVAEEAPLLLPPAPEFNSYEDQTYQLNEASDLLLPVEKIKTKNKKLKKNKKKKI